MIVTANENYINVLQRQLAGVYPAVASHAR